MDKYYTTKTAAEYLGITPAAVRQLIGRGTLPAKMLGDCWVISEGALLDRATSESAKKKSRRGTNTGRGRRSDLGPTLEGLVSDDL